MALPKGKQPIRRRGAVAVIVRQRRLLVIRRSQQVAAPGKYCFPGGGVESNESEQQALCRELQEELTLNVRPLRRLWRSKTSWNVDLAWWEAAVGDHAVAQPNEDEVTWCGWLTIAEISALPDLLESNREFLAALQAGKFALQSL